MNPCVLDLCREMTGTFWHEIDIVSLSCHHKFLFPPWNYLINIER